MKRLYLLSTLLLMMMVAMLPQNVKAQISVWDGTAVAWTHGNGTQSNPYLIENAQNLAWLATQVNAGNKYNGTYFKLSTNLDMNSLAWAPIGTDSNWFEGHFDGDNLYIDHLQITNCSKCGLFGVTSSNMSVENVSVRANISSSINGAMAGSIIGYVKNSSNTGGKVSNCHCMEGSSIIISDSNNSSYAGGIIGNARCISVTNCSNKGVLAANNHTGGVVGLLFHSTLSNCHNYGNIITTRGWSGGIAGDVFTDVSITISNCHNEGEIHGGTSGGLFGEYSATSSFNTITKCYNLGDVFGAITGGLVGSTWWININNCYNSGNVASLIGGGSWRKAGGIVAKMSTNTNISNCFNTGDISSTCTAGGIVADGPLIQSNASTISNCYNTGDISAVYHESSSWFFAGGIISSGGYLSINNCYNTGNVTAHYLDVNHSNSGGVMGDCYYDVNIRNCYNTGFLSASSAGGIRGCIGDGGCSVTNCYYLENCGGTVSGGVAKSETVMKSSSFPNMLNSGTSVYKMDIDPAVNQGYPIFNNIVYTLTLPPTNITKFSATFNGAYSGTVSVVGFRYKNILDTEYNYEYVQGSSPVSVNINGLQEGSTYQYQLFAQVNDITYYGEPNVFSTIGVDVNSYAQSDNILLYPNPTNNQLHVQIPCGNDMKDMKLQVLDAYGKLLMQMSIEGETTQINLSSLSDGVYFVRIMQRDETVLARKVIKMK